MMPTSADLSATAFHEAGHAVLALLHGRPVGKVSILASQRRLGHCEIRKGSFGPRHDILETEMLILFGGPAAEARHVGDYCWNAAAQDLRDVRQLARLRAPNERQAERLERRLLDKVEHLLDRAEVWTAVERIAAELLERTTISGRAARHLFDEAARSQ